jgi:hypothetical protein
LVCPTGIEPVTHSLEGCCSIQLSYGQKLQDSQKHILRNTKGPHGPLLFVCLSPDFGNFLKVKQQEMVGAAGFELATLCSQSRCATRLRYAPTNVILTFKNLILGRTAKKVSCHA